MDLIIILTIISILGLIISLYFLIVYKGIIKGMNKLLPKEICSENTCNAILETRFAKVFKIPNFILGIFYYIIILLASLYPYYLVFFRVFFILLSWFVVAFSLYLAYTLIFKLRTICVLCFISQIINLGIAILLCIL